MSLRSTAACLALTFTATVAGGPGAQALTLQECSAKYRAAQSAGTLKGMKWNDFRKSECGSDAAAAPTAAPTTTTTAAPKTESKPVTRQTSAPAAPIGNAVFPSAVSPKYSKESEGKARMHTCLDQYNSNKATNSNGGMKWIEKGGGYYSECNKRLKG